MTNQFSSEVTNLLQQYEQSVPSVAYLLCDRHDQDMIAMYYENKTNLKKAYTYRELKESSIKFASVLQNLGIEKGDAVAVLLPKGPELLISVLAIWRLGAVHVPLFTAFGPQAISYRVKNSRANVIITDETNRPKLNNTESEPSIIYSAKLSVITLASSDNKVEKPDIDFWDSLNNAEPISNNTAVTGSDVFILLFTSGTTGQPKGVEVPIHALAAFEGYMRYGLDLHKDDIFWNIADPGWAYGLYFGLVSPMLLGQTFIMIDAPFNVDQAYRVLEEYKVTNFAGAPTAYRLMRAEGIHEELKSKLKLRVLSSAGEPLNPDISTWAKTHLGVPIYDQFGQTELGMVINNHHFSDLDFPIKRGSMGIAMPGFRVVIIDLEGNELEAGVEGLLAVDAHNSPFFWFPGYYNDKVRTKEQFSADSRYYLTGDTASRDSEYFFYFSGRSDDIITSAGYKIGPFEVENALMGHEALAEAAVVGIPDRERGEIVKAFVVLRSGYLPSKKLSEELKLFVKANLSAHEYPREVEFIDELPKTPSGKIQRFLLRS